MIGFSLCFILIVVPLYLYVRELRYKLKLNIEARTLLKQRYMDKCTTLKHVKGILKDDETRDRC